ncbi:MAG: ATP-binding cassette domain-containing protein [Enterococcus sp.]
MTILAIHQLTKQFGATTVLDELSLQVPRGSIFGFVGENGAGKTTTMKLILGLESPTSGTITINGEAVKFGATPTNRITGYLPDVPVFYNYMNASDYLQLCGEITGMEKQYLKQRIDEMLKLVGLHGEKKKIRGFSRGMKQRLGIAQALLNEPELLICDEPTSALDPSGRNEFLELLASLRGQTTILFSTHILPDVERICDYVGILAEGKLKVTGTIEELKERFATPQIEVVCETSAVCERLLNELEASNYEAIQRLTPSNQTLTISYQGAYQALATELFATFAKRNIYPVAVKKIDPTLEDIFLEVTQ